MTYTDLGLAYYDGTTVLITGYHRGYVPVAKRGEDSALMPVPASVAGLRGNFRKAMQRLIDAGYNFYTTYDQQHQCSTQYCYTTYRGWRIPPEMIPQQPSDAEG